MTHATDIIDPKTAETLAGLFYERVRRTPQACAYHRFNPSANRFEAISWEETMRLAACWQEGLARENLRPGDRVAVMMHNRLEWVLFDLAALGLGLVTVPIFSEDRAENAAFILNETGCRLILVESETQWKNLCASSGRPAAIDRVLSLQASHSSNMNPSQPPGQDPWITSLEDWLPALTGPYHIDVHDADAMATIVYTSGTTGRPKGVMLSHANILENAFACLQREAIYPDDVLLSFLPLSHTFERTVGYYIPMMAGASVAHARSIDKLAEDMSEMRPTILISVPRIYERIHAKISAGLEQKPVWMQLLFHLAVAVGWKRFVYLQGRALWSPLLLLQPLLRRLVARRLMARFGGRLRLSISGGAALSFPIMRVFIGLGLNLLQGYGLTETSPVIAFNSVSDNVPETVGRLLSGIDSVIAADGELSVRGPNIMLGYWHDEEATRAAIDAEGYLHTGDIARMDSAGHLHIAGRIKDILVLSNGEKVSPGDLEQAISTNPLFEQTMIIGEGKPYLAALVVLNRTRWEQLAAHRGIEINRKDPLNSENAKRILLDEIAGLIRHFPGYAQIRRVHASLDPWSVQEGLITATLKLRRNKLLKRFQREVELLFEGHG